MDAKTTDEKEGQKERECGWVREREREREKERERERERRAEQNRVGESVLIQWSQIPIPDGSDHGLQKL
jgi:hypothetical protein